MSLVLVRDEASSDQAMLATVAATRVAEITRRVSADPAASVMPTPAACALRRRRDRDGSGYWNQANPDATVTGALALRCRFATSDTVARAQGVGAWGLSSVGAAGRGGADRMRGPIRLDTLIP